MSRRPPLSLFEPPSRPRRTALPPGARGIATATAPQAGSAEAPYTVGKLGEQIQEVLAGGFPRSLWLEGELSQVNKATAGHLYLTFSEGRTVLDAVAWESDARHFGFRPERGDRVRALGMLRAYTGRSRYQLLVQRLEPAGLGALLQELVERERRLAAEGLFDESRKRPVPFLPLRIGLLTAVGSDAWADFIKSANSRFPGVLIRERNTPVQGAPAPAALAAGIRALGREPLDVIVVARGGGSREDLLPFSDEAVVRAAAACPVPLVSAIGHEQDRPLLDRAADRRSSTPSAAARDILPERSELLRELDARRSAVGLAVQRWTRGRSERIEAFRTHRAMAAFPGWVERERRDRARDPGIAREASQRTVGVRADGLRRIRLRLEENHPARRLADQLTGLARMRERLAGLPLLRGTSDRIEAFRTHRAMTAVADWVERERRDRSRDPGIAREASQRTVGVQADRLRRIRLRLEENHPARRLADQRTGLARIRERLAGLPLLHARRARLGALRDRTSPAPFHRRLDALGAELGRHRVRYGHAAARCLERCRIVGEVFRERLDARDPRAVLRRGYSLALDPDGRAVSATTGVAVGDRLRLLLASGELGTRVEDIRRPSAPPAPEPGDPEGKRP